ncbi:EAL domain-containing protein [Enterobacter kobei]|uniref:EAL domain-containing protein n=1 Tax=Enterobacter kobei TaxID=208224 RepID=UPI003BEEDE57
MKKSSLYLTLLDYIGHKLSIKKSKDRARRFNRFIEKTGVYPFVQPIFNTDGDAVIGCEILLRLKTRDGYITPGAYINELEESEHINVITCKLLAEVTKYFLLENCELPEGFYFSLNIFAPQLSHPDIIRKILSFNAAFKGKASLVLEIVERGTLALDDSTMETMEELMSKGIRFAIDDFGAGTSSLKYIEHVGFSTIKIDRALTLATGNKLIYAKVIDAIVTLSSRLGLSVTAEGIENSVQQELLHKAGVNAMQGYYLARPMDLNKFGAMLRSAGHYKWGK